MHLNKAYEYDPSLDHQTISTWLALGEGGGMAVGSGRLAGRVVMKETHHRDACALGVLVMCNC